MNEEMVRQAIGRLHNSATRLVRDSRRANGAELAGARLSALSTIAASGPLSLAELAAREGVRAPTMSRMVEALVREGLIIRETDDRDRRLVRITATSAGKSLLDQAHKAQAGILAARFKRLGDSEQRALLRGIELLERITAG